MTKPMTTEELFNKIHDILKEKGRIPDILDYGLATHRPVPVKTYEFDLVNKLVHGGSEGIYFTWEGVDVYVLDENGKRYSWSCTCCDMETALRRKDELLKKYPQVVVRDNESRREEKFVCP